MQDIHWESITKTFQQIVGDAHVLTTEEDTRSYGADCTETLCYPPKLVVFPSSTQEVSEIMKVCYAERIPVTPRGAGTGLAGGAIPVEGGIVLSLARMNKILFIDEENLQVVTEPGVITQVLQETVAEKGLFYPPDPSSRGSCFIGGNVSTNSGGPKAVKYGVVRDYVLNLEVVLPNGDIIETGANVLKNSTGYALTQLMIGSEGTLGIITKIVLKLIPLPKYNRLLLASFNELENAGAAVSAIFRAGVIPSALELVEVNALKIVQEFVNKSPVPIDDQTQAHLLIEVDGNDPDVIMKQIEQVCEVLESFGCTEMVYAEDEQQKEMLWLLRRRVAEAVKAAGYTIEEDTVVPRAKLPELIKAVKSLGKIEGFDVVCYGHAGDGNLHIRLKIPDHTYSYKNTVVEEKLKKLFQCVYALGGTVSGEHGIGMLQKPYLSIVMKDPAQQLFAGIKKAFDPYGILNPGKIIN
jgi:glycolate oxidase